MSSRLRNGIIIAVVGILLVVSGVFVLINIFSDGVASQQVPTPVLADTENVVVTTHDLPLGAILQLEDLKLAVVPIGLIPRNAIIEKDLQNQTAIKRLVGKITKFQLVSGEMVLQHHLADPTNVNSDLAYILEADHVLMAFPAIDLMSRQGIIQVGDIVDIFVSIEIDVGIVESGTFGSVEEEKIRALFTFDAMQQIKITAMVVEIITTNADGTSSTATTAAAGPEVGGEDEGSGGSTTGRGETLAYLLSLKPQDALVLKYFRDSGAIFDIVIRSRISTEDFVLTPVTEEYIREFYGLEILR